MKTRHVQEWCHKNHGAAAPSWGKDSLLKLTDVKWILDKEGGETTLMKEDPATGGFLIRAGQYITLGGLFFMGGNKFSCCDLYRTYLSLDISCKRASDC